MCFYGGGPKINTLGCHIILVKNALKAKQIRQGRQLKDSFWGFGTNFCYFGAFSFFLNSGGRELPGVLAEIDFDRFSPKNETNIDFFNFYVF